MPNLDTEGCSTKTHGYSLASRDESPVLFELHKPSPSNRGYGDNVAMLQKYLQNAGFNQAISTGLSAQRPNLQ